jgi:hypothetical protein
MRVKFGCMVAIGASLLAATPGCDDSPQPVTYVASADAFLIAALVTDDGSVAVYACDGQPGTNEPYPMWFVGQLVDGSATLKNHNHTVTLTVDGDDFSGQIIPADTRRDPLDFAGVPAGEHAGIFYGDQYPYEGEWIFTDDGEQRGAVLNRKTKLFGFTPLTSASQTTLALPDKQTMKLSKLTVSKEVLED